MYLPTVIVLSLLLGGISLYISVKVLKRFSWFFAWLRGTFGLLFLLFSIIVLVFAIDLSNYEELLEEKPIASITFEKITEQHYKASISYYINYEPATFDIYGDQWQVDARIIRWTGAIAAIGAKPGYKLDRISGRYYSIEEERGKQRSVFPLSDESTLVDSWKILERYGDFLPGIDASYGSATYLPMADQAMYQLTLSYSGLAARPANEIAKTAVKLWR